VGHALLRNLTADTLRCHRDGTVSPRTSNCSADDARLPDRDFSIFCGIANYAPRVSTAGVRPFRWLTRDVMPVLIGAVLAIAILVAGVFLVVRAMVGGSSEYCTDSVKGNLVDLAGEVSAPSGSTARNLRPATCDDSFDFAYATRAFRTNEARVGAVLVSLRSGLEAKGWARRPRHHLDADAVYFRRSEGKAYWAELSAGQSAVFLTVSIPDPCC
jgi:hypothetical protein